MTTLELEVLPQMVEQRRAYLRSLAGHGGRELRPQSFRQRAGRALVRMGVWLEGRRADERVGTLLPLPMGQPRLADSVKRA